VLQRMVHTEPRRRMPDTPAVLNELNRHCKLNLGVDASSCLRQRIKRAPFVGRETLSDTVKRHVQSHFSPILPAKPPAAILFGETGIGKTVFLHQMDVWARLQGYRVIPLSSGHFHTTIDALAVWIKGDKKKGDLLDHGQAIVDFLATNKSGSSPFLFLVDDLDCFETAEQEALFDFIFFLSERLEPGKHLFLVTVGTSSDQVLRPFWERLDRHQSPWFPFSLTMSPLTRPEIEKLLSSILGSIHMDRDLKRRCCEMADGNPLRLEAVLAFCFEQGVIRRNRISVLPKNNDLFMKQFQDRDPVRLLVESLKSSPPLERDLALLLSCLGSPTDITVLQTSGLFANEVQIQQALESLLAKNLIVSQNNTLAMRYSTLGEMLVDGGLASAGFTVSAVESKRREILQALESIPATVKCELNEQLFLQHLKLGESEDVLIDIVETGETFIMQGRPDSARKLFRLAVEDLLESVSFSQRPNWYVALAKLAEHLISFGDYDRLRQILDRTIEQVERLERGKSEGLDFVPVRLALLRQLIRLHRYDGDLQACQQRLDEGWAVIDERDLVEKRLAFANLQATLFMHLGQYARCSEVCAKALVLEDTPNKLSVQMRLMDGHCRRMLRQYNEAKDLYDQAILDSDRIKYQTGMANALQSKGLLARIAGDMEEAKNHFSRALSLFETFRNRGGVGSCQFSLSRLSFESLKIDKALTQIQSAISIFRQLNNRRNLSAAMAHLGSMLLFVGFGKDGTAMVRSALWMAEAGSYAGVAAECHWLLFKEEFSTGHVVDAKFHLKSELQYSNGQKELH